MAEEHFKGMRMEYPDKEEVQFRGYPGAERFNKSMYSWFQSVFRISPRRLKRSTMTDLFARLRRGETVKGIRVRDIGGEYVRISGPKKGTTRYKEAASQSKKHVTESGTPRGIWKMEEAYSGVTRTYERREAWAHGRIVIRDILGRFASKPG